MPFAGTPVSSSPLQVRMLRALSVASALALPGCPHWFKDDFVAGNPDSNVDKLNSGGAGSQSSASSGGSGGAPPETGGDSGVAGASPDFDTGGSSAAGGSEPSGSGGAGTGGVSVAGASSAGAPAGEAGAGEEPASGGSGQAGTSGALCAPGCSCADRLSHLYIFGPQLLGADEAEMVCQSVGHSLVDIMSATRNEWLASTALELGIGDIWTDGNDRAVEGEWQWGDTVFFTLGEVPTAYTAWEPGQPDAVTAEDDCLTLVPATQTWRDRLCSFAQAFICVSLATP